MYYAKNNTFDKCAKYVMLCDNMSTKFRNNKNAIIDLNKLLVEHNSIFSKTQINLDLKLLFLIIFESFN